MVHIQAFAKVTNWQAAIGRRALGVVGAYFGDDKVFRTMEDIKEHVEWLLPAKDGDECEEADESEGSDDDGSKEAVSIEDVVRRRKRKFVGAPFLWENGLIGPGAKIEVHKCTQPSSCVYGRSYPHPPL